MTRLLLFIFFLLTFLSQVFSITAGVGEWSILLSSPVGSTPSRWASIEQSSKNEWESLTNEFTVQLYVNWFGSSSNQTGREVIISRHPSGGEVDGRTHFAIGVSSDSNGVWRVNAWVGCGVAIGYSLTSSISLPSRTWTRLALVVNGDGTFETNSSATLYQNGVQVANSSWNFAECGPRYGIQWQYNADDVRLGYYDNQDHSSWNPNNLGSIYGFNGLVDELSFFPYPLTITPLPADQVFEYSGQERGLIYFQFNEGPRDRRLLQDFTKKLNSLLKGRPAIQAALGPLGLVVPNDPAAYVPSEGLVINQVALINGSSPAHPTPLVNTIYLSFTPNPNTSITPSIIALSPLLSSLVTDGLVRIYSNGQSLKSLPFTLSSNKLEVIYICQNRSCQMTGAAFQYQVAGSIAILELSPTPFCPSNVFDVCGECDGDNRTCTCVCYHGFRSKYMAYELFKFGLEQVVAQTNQTLTQLREVLKRVKALGNNPPPQLAATFPARITKEKRFDDCVRGFCTEFGNFFDNFTSLLPLPERTGLPFDSCSCDPDTRYNV